MWWRVVRPRRTLADDFLGWFVSDEWLGVVVPVFGPGLDGIDEVGDAGEHTAAQAAVGQFLEPPLEEPALGVRSSERMLIRLGS